MQRDSEYNRYDLALVACLRAAVWQTPCDIDTAILNDNAFWQAAYRQSCGHLLSVWAINQGLTVADAARRKIQVFSVYQRTVRQNRLLCDLVTLLRLNGIETVLLKGYGLSLLYPKTEMREYGDIDLYVGEENYDKTVALIRKTYPQTYWFSEEHVSHHFLMQLDENCDRVAEFHNVVMDLPGMKKAEQAFTAFTLRELQSVRTISLDGIDIAVPSVRFNAVYVFIHAWHHFSGNGVGVRQLADWMLCLHELAQTLSAEEKQAYAHDLERLLRRMSMLQIWQTFGCVIVRHLGLPKEEFLLYNASQERRGERLYRQLLHDGHGYRLANKEKGATIHSFPFHRPEKNRIAQVLFTLVRIPYDTFQLAKIFPHLAIRQFFGKIRLGVLKVLKKTASV